METHLLQDLAIVMATAGAMTLLCHRFRQPVVIGYLLAGLIIGPYTPPFSLVVDFKNIHTMAELGLVFLLFSLGLEFNLPKIKKVGLSAGLAAVMEVLGMLVIGYFLGQGFGWSKTDSLFLGAILSISSTTIIVKVFMDFKMMREDFVQVVFGILVLEDVVAVAILSILSGLGSNGSPGTAAVVLSFSRIGLFVVLFLVLGLFLIPRFVHWVASYKEKEVLGIVTLGLCLGGALIAASFRLSTALGAFLTGAILAASKEIDDIEDWVHPIRDMFSAIFFVSAGMLIQPALLWTYKGPIILVTLVTLVGKVLSGATGSFLAGFDVKTSARVGMSLAQIGEFSFVIASLGLSLKVTSDFLYPVAIAVSSLTTLATPYLIRRSDTWVTGLLNVLPASVRVNLDRYHDWLEASKTRQRNSHGSAILSKYLVRLGVYVALFVFLVMILKGFSILLCHRFESQALMVAGLLVFVWFSAGLMALPLFTALSKYANHLVLLLVTRSKRLLHFIDVHLFYNTLDALTMALLDGLFVLAAASFIRERSILVGLVLGLFLAGVFFRRAANRGKEWLEAMLDQIMGLATSEPTRQAVLRSGDRKLLLVDITDQVTLNAGSPAVNRTIREIKLREQTGATIVAIYRNGTHLANPGPDTPLQTDDILVLLGSQTELTQAKSCLDPL